MRRLVLFIFTVLMMSKTAIGSSIDSKIRALSKAPPHKRYVLMNQIKMELARLNQAQRDRIIKKLFRKSNKSSYSYNRVGLKRKQYLRGGLKKSQYKYQHVSKGKKSRTRKKFYFNKMSRRSR
jgi:hypothetical protein